MKKLITLSLAILCLTSVQSFSQSGARQKKAVDWSTQLDTRVDNNGYWKMMAAKGLTKLNDVQPVAPAVFSGSEIKSSTVITDDSPDVPVAPANSTQSETSVFVNPLDNQNVINSNNSSQNPLGSFYGANSLQTDDGGLSWGGTVQGAGGYNSGDPVALIGLDGTHYIGFINANYGQGISVSTNGGTSYTSYNVANASGGGILDKNHLWIDNSPTSNHEGNLYDAWTDFYGPIDSEIGFSRSTDGGVTWSAVQEVSSETNAGSHCQGVNISSGPYGEVYVIWAIYDGWPTDETSIGMARSFDGGATFGPAERIINDIRGIRNTGVGKNMRVNSFPCMAVDISGGENNGNIYIVWANVGVPGINTGSDVDVYLAISEDQGTTWSTPVRVNQDPIGQGSKHYFPWITCDPETGDLSIVFYDDRNVGGSQCEVYCANSFDGGLTWEDFKVSDVAFTPAAIPGLADGYMGDYIAINARGGWVYPVWADTRTGSVMSYCSPYQTNPLVRPTNLSADVVFETGLTSLQWNYEEFPGFSYFMVYFGNEMIGTTTDTMFSHQLPDYGIYTFKVSAFYEGVGESSTSSASVQWGDAQISVNPAEIYETLMPDSSTIRYVTVQNVGQLEMNYDISLFVPTLPVDGSRDYCTASGTCDEYISRVQLNEIDNSSDCSQYGNYTGLSTAMSVGNTYEFTVTNGNPIYSADECGLWVDWDQDGTFEDTEEVSMEGTPGVGPYTATIEPPIGAAPGTTRLRTRITYAETPQPCGETTYGEVEDYTVYVVSWVNAEPTTGTVQAGESLEIAVNLNAQDMAIGTYTAEMKVFSNDPDNPEIVVPITMDVVNMAVNVTADQLSICEGESVQLTSEVVGGTGSLTYEWTSEPAGFISGEPNPLVTPLESVTYFLSVTNGLFTVEDSVSIQVNPFPEVDLGADQEICDGDSVILSVGEGYSSYLWSTGETVPTVTLKTSGEYWVRVSSEHHCVTYDTMNVAVNLYPGKAVITNGPAMVDNFVNTSSVFICEAAANALTYQWTVSPAEAGTTASTGTTAEINWNAGYTGPVQVTVVAQNDCGTGEPSDVFSTEIYSSQGIIDIGTSSLVIYPNPGAGLFTVKLPLASTTGANLKVTDASGTVVYSRADVIYPAGGQVEVNLSGLADGVYTLQVISGEKLFTGKLILRQK